MRPILFSVLILFLVGAWIFALTPESVHSSNGRTPILVELFTSEGCSSCPPADRFLQKLDAQPVVGAQIIVLSEHVDYWNHIGWKDPYSSHFYSERQNSYARHFGLSDVYTPQMVVDGVSEFVGGDPEKAEKAFAKAVGGSKVTVRLSSIVADSKQLHAHLEVGPLDATPSSKEREVYVAVALNRAESQVSGGENSGRKLTHVAVVRNLAQVGTLKEQQSFSRDVELKLESGADPQNLRLIAFVQEAHQGRVLGATSLQVSGK